MRIIKWLKDLRYPLGYQKFSIKLGFKRIFCHIFGCNIKLDYTGLLRCSRCGIYGFVDNSPKLIKKRKRGKGR